MGFRVELGIYRGPMDLLLYLVRKQELDLMDVPIARVAEQYIEHLSVLEQLNADEVGEFIELASMLLEIKSQMLLPSAGEEIDTLDDPRDQLVERLLEYKRYKDAASMLDERSRAWQLRCVRVSDDLPPRSVDLVTQPIQELELWDLVSAFGRILRDNQATQPSNIVYDGTPIHVYMRRIHERLLRERQVSLSEMFEPRMHKSAIIGVFLAILELVRHHCVRAEQAQLHGEILVVPGEELSEQVDFSDVGTYGGRAAAEAELPETSR